MRRFFPSAALLCAFVACGGGKAAENPQAPTPVTPTPDAYKASLPPGPVAKLEIGIHYVDIDHQGAPGTALRDPYTEGTCGPSGQPCWVLFPGEFVQLDADQTNAQGKECQWTTDPSWASDDAAGAIRVRDSSRPFELRFDVVKPGDVKVQATVDGVRSNELWLRVSSGRKPY